VFPFLNKIDRELNEKYIKIIKTEYPHTFDVVITVNGKSVPFQVKKISRWIGDWNYYYGENKVDKNELESIAKID
jgi:hypothetical protein